MTALASGLSPLIPNNATIPIAVNATFQPNNPFNWRQDLVRLDYRLNDKNSLYGRYLHDNFNLVDGFGTFVDAGFYRQRQLIGYARDMAFKSAKPGSLRNKS